MKDKIESEKVTQNLYSLYTGIKGVEIYISLNRKTLVM